MSGKRKSCFHEADRSVPLGRRAAAEGLGTMLLVFAASAASLGAARLLPAHAGFATIVGAVAVAGILIALINAFGPLSGGHFNPLITVLQMLAGERSRRCTAAYTVAQLTGGLVGGALNLALWHGTPAQFGGLGWRGAFSEFAASAGLLIIVLATTRGSRVDTGPFAVGSWLFAAIIATPTGSYANPAFVIGALVLRGPLSLGSASVVPYTLAEIAGAFAALAVMTVVYPIKEGIS